MGRLQAREERRERGCGTEVRGGDEEARGTTARVWKKDRKEVVVCDNNTQEEERLGLRF